MQLVFIALGGAIGSVGRYLVSLAVNQRIGVAGGFPFGTLAVNGIGSFLIGLLFIVLHHQLDGHAAQDNLKALLLVGLLGGFTTFSTFSLETLHLLDSGLWSKALLNIIASLVICIGAAAIGIAAAKLTT